MTSAFANDHVIKYDAAPGAANLDTGALAVRDMIFGVHARVFLSCVGDRVLQCMGCMDGESRFDSIVLDARNASGLPSSTNVFKVSHAEAVGQMEMLKKRDEALAAAAPPGAPPRTAR